MDSLRKALEQAIQEKARQDKPEPYKQYRLIGRQGEPSIAKGNTWAESEVQPL